MGWPSWGRIASAVVAAVLVTAPFVSPEEESPSASSPTVTSSTSTVETPPMTTGADTPVVSTQPIPATTSADTTSQDDADAETTTTQTAPPDTDLADVVTVTAIIDGDTFDVTTAAGDPERVRLFGVNTPETGECLNPNFMDYKLMRASDMPEIEIIIVEPVDPNSVYGVKGVGEMAAIPTAPAVRNAIFNATGAKVFSLPLTPERVLAAIKEMEAEA